MNKKYILCGVICFVVAGVSFFGGMKYGQSKNPVSNFGKQGNFNQMGGVLGQNGSQRMRGGNNGGLVSGEIISKDDKSMTVKLRDGGSKIVFFSTSTKVEKTVDGIADDAVVGKQVMINGTPNSDGSVSATSIQIRPTIPVVSNTSVKQ